MGSSKWLKSVQVERWWWNYTPIKGAKEYRIDGNFDPNHPKNKGTGNIDSSGVPTEITLFIQLKANEDKRIILEERKGNWASIPPWPYALETVTTEVEGMRCRGLKKFVTWHMNR